MRKSKSRTLPVNTLAPSWRACKNTRASLTNRRSCPSPLGRLLNRKSRPANTPACPQIATSGAWSRCAGMSSTVAPTVSRTAFVEPCFGSSRPKACVNSDKQTEEWWHIGLGVNEVQVCLDALEYTDLDAFLLAGRYTLLDHAGARPLVEACRMRGASLVVGGVFNSGILATGPVEGALYDYQPATADILQRTARIQAVCLEFDIDLPTAALQFVLASDAVSSVLLGVSSERNLARNLSGFRTALPRELWDALVDRELIQGWTRPA